MKLRSWPILAVAFGTMMLLTVLFGLDSWRRADRIYATVLSMHEADARTQEALREIESGVYRSGLLIRDFLLDPSNLTAELHKQELLGVREEMEANLNVLRVLTTASERQLLDSLHQENAAYWESLNPVFEWTPQQKTALSWWFLRRQVLPRRQAVMQIAREVKALTAADFERRRRNVQDRMSEYQRAGERMLVTLLVLAAVVALLSGFRLWLLERRAEQERLRAEDAEHEMRRLSHKLVQAQEEERRRLSRELHDEVGQMLTALRVELGNLDRLRHTEGEGFHQHMEDAKALAARTLGSVRDLASGLRPSVLDDLGLGPALKWQAREFSRRTDVPVEVAVDDLPDDLPDEYRTCIYRVVQEALTNCARHADARQIRIALQPEPGGLCLTIEDDGKGIPNGHATPGARPPAGLGLLGMEERVRELKGTMTVTSQPGKGTTLKVSIPLQTETVKA